MKTYCVTNNGDCKSCSLVSYGRDCANYPLTEQEFTKTMREQAQERVDRTPLLKAHETVIMGNPDGEEWHWEWVLQSGVQTIIEWAIRREMGR